MENTVWISNAFVNSDLIYPFSDEFSLSKDPKVREASERTSYENRMGESLPENSFPKELYAFRGSESDPIVIHKNLPDFFRGGDFVVSGFFADILRQFDLGGGGLYPTRLFQEDRVTEIVGDFYCLNFGNKKTAFLLEYSPRARKSRMSSHIDPPFDIQEDEIAVSPVALEGPDIWIDPTLSSTIFLSDRLWQSLAAAKVHKGLQAARCRVLEAT